MGQPQVRGSCYASPTYDSNTEERTDDELTLSFADPSDAESNVSVGTIIASTADITQ